MEYTEERATFERLNRVAKKGGVVLFGSTFASRIPFCELMRDYNDDTAGYNRSIKGLKIADARYYLDECIFQLEPSKIFISLGDQDIGDRGASCLADDYEWLLYRIHTELPEAKIYILSVYPTGEAAELNYKLKDLAQVTGCTYVNMPETGTAPEIRMFENIKTLFRTKPISFFDAMNRAL